MCFCFRYPTQYATIGITIRVRDVNEYAPQFGSAEYTAIISENSPIGTLVAQVSFFVFNVQVFRLGFFSHSKRFLFCKN